MMRTDKNKELNTSVRVFLKEKVSRTCF